MCVNDFEAGLLMYNLHTIKCTLSVSSSMSFDKWIQSCNHTQDTEHFHHPRKCSVKDFSKGGCESLDKHYDPTSTLPPLLWLPAGLTSCPLWLHSQQGWQCGIFSVWQTLGLRFSDPVEGSWHSVPVKNSIRNCSSHWSPLTIDFKVYAALGASVLSIQHLLLLC